MGSDIDTMRAARWRILRAIRKGGHIGLSEEILHDTMRSLFPLLTTQLWLRDHLDYLEREGLVEVDRHPSTAWDVHLTGPGYELVDYIAPEHPGVLRTPQPWRAP